jgi:hypothetical protein
MKEAGQRKISRGGGTDEREDKRLPVLLER